MDKNSISNLTNEELIEVYKKVDVFLDFLEKEKSNKEKDEDDAY